MIKIWEKQDGTILVTNFIKDSADIEKTKTELEMHHGILTEKDVTLPNDKYFRGAWRIKGDKVVEDLSKAKEIQMNKIRKERDKKLVELDIETLKGNDNQVEKQKLRDLPKTFDLDVAKTADDLRNLWPEELK